MLSISLPCLILRQLQAIYIELAEIKTATKLLRKVAVCYISIYGRAYNYTTRSADAGTQI